MTLNMIPMSNSRLFALLSVLALAQVGCTQAQEKQPLKLEFPAPTLKGTPEDLPKGPNIEPPPFLMFSETVST